MCVLNHTIPPDRDVAKSSVSHGTSYVDGSSSSDHRCRAAFFLLGKCKIRLSTDDRKKVAVEHARDEWSIEGKRSRSNTVCEMF